MPQTPTVTVNPPVPGPGGQFRDFTSLATFDTAEAAAGPGDVLRATATVTAPLIYRGNKNGITGGSAADGADGNPITITCNPGIFIDPNNQSNNVPAIDVQACDHVHVVGANVRRSQFGIRYLHTEGTAANPLRVAFNTVEDTGHAAIAIQGWFQLITTSGGTPPAGAGNERGYTRQFLVEANTIVRPGRTADQFGEGIYCGVGSAPGWVSRAESGTIRYNDITQWTADALDIKPGCRFINVFDNYIHDGYSVFGAPLQLLYVGSGLDDRPAYADVDPELYVEGNRITDNDITTTNGSSAEYMCQIGLSGTRMANNLFWAWPNTQFAMRARIEKPEAQFGTHETYMINNLCWGNAGFQNAGFGSPLVGPITTLTFVQRNNLGFTTTTDVQFNTATTNFEASVPAIGVAGDAEWSTFGPGSAFDLIDGHTVGAGASISDLTRKIAEGVSQRGYGATVNPGPFQVFIP